MKKKGFTLIELIAVLVILAILALIVTPLVMNIIRKSKLAADKRSIDGYGRAIELAIATYLLDGNEIPASIDQLAVEYSGNKVECSTTKINSDATVFLANCKVSSRDVPGYTYGHDKSSENIEYNIGDEVTYKGEDYYVIENSGINKFTVTLLKKNPLTVNEVSQNGIGYINKYTSISKGAAYNQNGYGGMTYYSSQTCGYVNDSWVRTECFTNYNDSDIKHGVDSWAVATIDEEDLVEARLITKDELVNNLGYEQDPTVATQMIPNQVNTPSWVYNTQYSYWTMTQFEDSVLGVWGVDDSGELDDVGVSNHCNYVVRPVITIQKIALSI